MDDEWRDRVRRALARKGWEQLDLARAVKCPPSVISELLTGKKKHSIYVIEIEAVLGWSPRPTSISDELNELLGLWDAMDDVARGRLLERARMLAEGAKKK